MTAQTFTDLRNQPLATHLVVIGLLNAPQARRRQHQNLALPPERPSERARRMLRSWTGRDTNRLAPGNFTLMGKTFVGRLRQGSRAARCHPRRAVRRR